VQTYGVNVAPNGVAGVQPGSSTVAAGMPGGVEGGGHFVLPAHRHRASSTGAPLGSITNPLLWIPAAVVLAAAGVQLNRRRRPSHRRRRHGKGDSDSPTASDPPPDDEPATGRQLTLAAKGDPS
jgi:hypothetical protein